MAYSIYDKATYNKYVDYVKNDNLQKTKKAKIKLTNDEVEYSLKKDLLFINEKAKEDFIKITSKQTSKLVALSNNKESKMSKIQDKITKLQEQIKLLEMDYEDVSSEKETINDDIDEFINAVYDENIVYEEAEQTDKIERKSSRKLNDYIQNGEVLLHRISGEGVDYGAIPLDHDLSNMNNIWSATWQDNLLVMEDGTTFKNGNDFMKAHYKYLDLSPKRYGDVFKGSIKVVRKSLCEATKKNDFKQGYYELSCLSKMKPLDQYEANELKVLTTKS